MILFLVSLLLGVLCIISGAYMIYSPLGLILLGVFLVGLFGYRTIVITMYYGILMDDKVNQNKIDEKVISDEV